MKKHPMAALVVPVVPLVPVAPAARRRPRLLWANVYCLFDNSSGASMAVRQMLLQLVKAGWDVFILGSTVFDHERGTAGLHGQWPAVQARRGEAVSLVQPPATAPPRLRRPRHAPSVALVRAKPAPGVRPDRLRRAGDNAN